MNAVAAFLTPAHRARWTAAVTAARTFGAGPEPATDDAARQEARRLLGALGAAGWLSAADGRDVRELCLLREAMAAASPLADEVIAIQGLGATPLALAGTEAQRERWLGPITRGEVMSGFAMSEPEAGSDVAALQTTAVREGDGWRLDGQKHLISNAGIADLYLVFARTAPTEGSRGISAFLVPHDTPGFEFAGAQTMAAAHPLGRLRFERCRVPGDALVGEEGHGFKLGMMTLDRLRPTVGAAACGMAARALDEAVAHARRRRQFGQALADMPLVREKIGRMATDLDAARLLVYRAAWQIDTAGGRQSVAAAMAKGFATEMAQRVVDEAIQIIGGPAVLLGHPVERLYRAVRALRIYEGATDIQRLIVAGGVLDEAARP